jgi:hypothetical protein
MKCLFRGREIDSATDPEYLAWFAEITSKIAPYDYDPDIDLENGRRLNLQAERISLEYWRKACTRRAKTRVALAGFRRAAKERQKAAQR